MTDDDIADAVRQETYKVQSSLGAVAPDIMPLAAANAQIQQLIHIRHELTAMRKLLEQIAAK